MWAAQRHASLQETEAIYVQLFGLLSGRRGTWLGAERMGLALSHHHVAGEPLPVEVSAEDPSRIGSNDFAA